MGKKVLVVDDSSSIRGLTCMTLRLAKYDVVEACDGKEGLEMLTKGKVDLIITDLNMPNMDGIDFIKTVKSSPNHKFIPMVMLTTEGGDKKKEEGRIAGARAWITKPFQADILLGVVKKIIG